LTRVSEKRLAARRIAERARRTIAGVSGTDSGRWAAR
jgi:hypothetical protein